MTPTVHLASSYSPAGARRSRGKLQKSDSGKINRVLIYLDSSDKGIDGAHVLERAETESGVSALTLSVSVDSVCPLPSAAHARARAAS